MYRSRFVPLLVVALLALPGAIRAEGGELAGTVIGHSSPLAAATVYAYSQAGRSFLKVATDRGGAFRFADLPAGLFRVIAHKPGFLPAVVLVTRASAEISQHLELHLQPDGIGDLRSGEEFWTLREQIPGDVLREIQMAELGLHQPAFQEPESAMNAEMTATAGVAQGTGHEALQVAAGRVGLEGRMGAFEIDLAGDYERRSASVFDAAEPSPSTGEQSALNLALRHADNTQVDLSTQSTRLLGRDTAGEIVPMDFERHSVSWEQATGDRSASTFRAQYIAENNFFRSGRAPQGVADASRTWNVDGNWSTLLGESHHLETGLSYRQQHGYAQTGEEVLADQWLQAYGRGEWQIHPSVLVEYGLYTSLRDGTLSLTPRGGLVLQMGESWRLGGTAAHRVDDAAKSWQTVGLRSAFYSSGDPCQTEQEFCYEVFVARKKDESNELRLGAVHREFGETLRLYFDDDLFQHLDSLFLVRGDELPELRFAITRKLSPRILARLQSSAGKGGGGLLYLTDNQPYTNDVRYIVASLDTKFQATSTGLFLAFHHLEQGFEAVDSEQERAQRLDLERLQLMLTQDLNVLADLAADWVVQLNLELRRDSAFLEGFDLETDPELERRLTGGIAVRF